jgi:hypothetical protein
LPCWQPPSQWHLAVTCLAADGARSDWQNYYCTPLAATRQFLLVVVCRELLDCNAGQNSDCWKAHQLKPGAP